MKIGLVRRGYSQTGGAEAYLRRFAEAAVAAGHEVLLFAEQWPRAEWPWAHLQVHSRGPWAFAKALHALRPRERCDFLFSLERVFSCDAYRAGDGVHAAWLERRSEFEPFWRPWFRRFSPKHRETLKLERQLFSEGGAGTVIANSRLVQHEIEDHFAFDSQHIHVVYNGVPATTADPATRAATRRDLGLRDDQLALLFVGSGWERKGLRYAMETVNALPQSARLFVIGRGSMAGLPRSQRRTRFLGPQTELGRFYAAADVFILPTLYDPFSNACLEALAAGLPVITTEHNGFSEIISDEEGGTVSDPRDITALVAEVQKWSDPKRRDFVRPNLRELGAKFSMEENVRQTLTLITR